MTINKGKLIPDSLMLPVVFLILTPTCFYIGNRMFADHDSKLGFLISWTGWLLGFSIIPLFLEHFYLKPSK
jgi:hypothetical protein